MNAEMLRMRLMNLTIICVPAAGSIHSIKMMKLLDAFTMQHHKNRRKCECREVIKTFPTEMHLAIPSRLLTIDGNKTKNCAYVVYCVLFGWHAVPNVHRDSR